MVLNRYASRNILSPEAYEKVYRERLQAKQDGNKSVSNTLKLALNTAYGAMLNKYNDLYDPLMGRSVCISGQLYLTDLVMAYLQECDTIRVINWNTDGVMFSIDEDEMSKVYTINAEWEERTGFVLEEDKIRKIVQRDVNNYLMVTLDGEVKVKGGELTRGIQSAGSAWNINNNAVIVAKALTEYFANDTPLEDTIEASTNILDFQFIAKAGSKYKAAYHLVRGEKVPVQKVNRVYASEDITLGTLYKIHAGTGRAAKIGGLPPHCIIDNKNELTIDAVDRSYYIHLARKKAREFLGIKPRKVNRRKVNKIGREALKLLN